MKTTKSPCKITGLDVTRIEIDASGSAPLAVYVEHSLIDEGWKRFGAAHHQAVAWPSPVLEAVKELRERIEQHLMDMYFENGGLDDTATAGVGSGRDEQRELAFPPPGLGEVELGGSEGEPGQV